MLRVKQTLSLRDTAHAGRPVRGAAEPGGSFWRSGVHLHVSDSHLNFNTWLDTDGGDLLHNIRWGVQVDQTLMDAHLPTVPSVGSLATRSLAHSKAEGLCWKANWTCDVQFL